MHRFISLINKIAEGHKAPKKSYFLHFQENICLKTFVGWFLNDTLNFSPVHNKHTEQIIVKLSTYMCG